MAVEDNIPNQINIPGSLIGRHESSDIAPIGFASFTTNMKSDIAPMGFSAFTTRMKSDVFPIPFANFTTAMKSDVFPLAVANGFNNQSSDIAPMASILGANNSLPSAIAPMTSILGANNQLSTTAPINSTLGANNQSSTTAPITSTLTGRFDASSVAPFISVLSGRHESSAIDSSLTTPDGRHESSAIDSSLTTPDGRHESSGIDDSTTTQTGRHESSAIDSSPTTPDGRHESSDIDDALTTPDGRFTSSDIDDTPTIADGRHESSAIDTTIGINFLDDTYATGFTVNQVPDGDFTAAATGFSPYPGPPGFPPGPSLLDGRHLSSLIDDTTGVNFVDIPNAAATGFTIQAQKYDTQFIGAVDDIYTYPDPFGLGQGSVDGQITNGVNFLDIDNLDATGFTPSQPYLHSQFQGISGQGPKPTYDYPDTHGLGFGILSNALFSAENTPYTTPIKPDGFSTDRGDELEVSLFSKNSFDGGGILGQSTEFTHPTFGGVQGQVPVMGNNPTGLGQFLEGGNTSGDIGIVDAFDDTTSGAKGFTPQMFDLGLPKTQFNGVAGTPGALTYEYPTDVGPAGIGRLMYDTPFSDAGNPYGGEYVSALTQQIPVNPLITINKDTGTDPVDFNFYKAAPDRLQFHEGNKYKDSIGSFDATIELNGMHPQSILADFAAREHSPSPLDSMQVLIPANTGPTGAPDVTAEYTTVEGYPNYNTFNLSYSDAEVANQRQGFVRNELFARTIDYDNSSLYGHDLRFGGHGDDPKGLKLYTEPHIIRPMGKKWNGIEMEGTPFDEGAFRGGFLTLGNRALLDVVRNAKHIIESPIKGLLWGLKQIGLQASNPKVETEMFFLGRRTRVFNLGIGLLANMLTGPFGIKLYRHGLLNGIGEGDSSYEAAVKAHGGISPYDPDRSWAGKQTVGKGGGNRLYSLKFELMYGDNENGAGGFLGLGNLLGFDGQKIDLLSDTALAGPKSLYGIGGTTIRRYYNSTKHDTGGDLSQHDELQGGQSALLARYSTLSHTGLDDAAFDREGRAGIADDFRKKIVDSDEIVGDKLFGTDPAALPYEAMSRDAYFGYTPYGTERDRRIPTGEDYTPAGLGDPFNDDDKSFANYTGYDDIRDGWDASSNTRDMIKFMIQDVATGKSVKIRSYLSDITDTITPNWQQQSYVGRPDQVHHYESTIRNLVFTLKLAATSQEDMQGMYRRLNFIYGLAYPHIGTYTGNTTVDQTMVSPYVRLTMGDWLYQTPGYFKSIATTIDNDYPWDINLGYDENTGQLPHIVSLNLDFAVIGDGPHTSAITGKEPEEVAGLHIGGGQPVETDHFFLSNLSIKDEE